MPISICFSHLLYDVFDGFICCFNCSIHLEPVRCVLVDFKLCTQGIHHIVVEIPSVIRYNGLRQAILIDDIQFDETSYLCLRQVYK